MPPKTIKNQIRLNQRASLTKNDGRPDNFNPQNPSNPISKMTNLYLTTSTKSKKATANVTKSQLTYPIRNNLRIAFHISC